MPRTSLGLLSSALFALSCSVVSLSAQDFGPHFLFNSGITGCLQVKGGDAPDGGELVVSDPCNTLPESRVEIMDGLSLDQARSVLRIKLTPQRFLCLTVVLPNPAQALPVLPMKVRSNPTCLPNTVWRVTAPDSAGLRSVVAVFEAPGVAAMCMQRRSRPGGVADVVIDNCSPSTTWKLDPIDPPFPPR
jgi:hypothetical protein